MDQNGASTRTLNICYVVNAVGSGSIPADIASAVNEHTSHNVEIATWFGSQSTTIRGNVEVIPVDAPDTSLGVDRATIQRASDIVRGFDLIQANHNHAGSFAKLLGFKYGIPVISREGNTRDGFTRKGRVANGLTNTLCNRIVCISDSVFKSFKRWERILVDEDNVKKIPNGVDLEAIDDSEPDLPEGIPAYEDSHLVGNAAMLYDQKAHQTLIRAVGRLNSRIQDTVELILCGDGPERATLESLAQDCEIEHLGHFVGMVERHTVYEILWAIDAFAMPSRWEGFCVAVAEALATNTPTVLSDIRTFRELYSEAALFHGVEEIGELSGAIEQLLYSTELSRNLANNGRSLVEERYELAEIASIYGQMYDNVNSDL